MVTKWKPITLIVSFIIAGLILCLALAGLCGTASCGQAALPITLLLLTYLLVYKLTPQIPVIARVMIGPPRKPPRLA